MQERGVAINEPGLIASGYSAFHNYSLGNQLLVRIPAKLNADSEDAERGFRASRTRLGA